MANDESVGVLLKHAEQSSTAGDVPTTTFLIDLILQQDFTNQRAWEILYKLIGGRIPFEEFQRNFAEKNYSDKLHLLYPESSWTSVNDKSNSNASGNNFSEPNLHDNRKNVLPPYLNYERTANNIDKETDSQPRLKKNSLREIMIAAILAGACCFTILVFSLLLFYYFSGDLTSTAGIFSTKVPTPISPTDNSTNDLTPVIITSQPTPLIATITPPAPIVATTIPPTFPVTTPVTPQQSSIPGPVQFLISYYNFFNNRDYASAWLCLSDNFKMGMGRKIGHPYDYTNDFIEYWKTVKSVEILSSNQEYQTSQSASVVLQLRVNMFQGSSITYFIRLHLIANFNSTSWLVNSSENWK